MVIAGAWCPEKVQSSSCDVSSLIELLLIYYRLQNSLGKKNFVLLPMHTTKLLPPSTARPCSLSPSWDWAQCPVYLLQRAGSWLPVRGLQQAPSTHQDPWQQLPVSTILILQVTHTTVTAFPCCTLNSYHIKCGNCLKYECLSPCFCHSIWHLSRLIYLQLSPSCHL